MTVIDSTLPAESASTEITRLNALKHGILSRYTVLPWENAGDYCALVDALAGEHKPQGPTEEHLVEELAGILWRKRRLRMAEVATFRRGLCDTTESYSTTGRAAMVYEGNGRGKAEVAEAIKSTPEELRLDLQDLEEDEGMTKAAIEFLRSGKANAYEKALKTLQADTREAWEDKLTWEPDDYNESDTPFTADTESLLRYLETEICDWYRKRRAELENLPLIQAQAFGEALNPDRLERLARYEVHLDRKFEKTLSMLIKLRDLRTVSGAD